MSNEESVVVGWIPVMWARTIGACACEIICPPEDEVARKWREKRGREYVPRFYWSVSIGGATVTGDKESFTEAAKAVEEAAADLEET